MAGGGGGGGGAAAMAQSAVLTQELHQADDTTKPNSGFWRGGTFTLNDAGYKYFVIEHIEFEHTSTSGKVLHCAYRVDDDPPTSDMALVAWSKEQSPTAGVDKIEVTSVLIPTGTIIFCASSSDSTSVRAVGSVASQNRHISKAHNDGLPTQVSDTWVAGTDGYKVKIYYRGLN